MLLFQENALNNIDLNRQTKNCKFVLLFVIIKLSAQLNSKLCFVDVVTYIHEP